PRTVPTLAGKGFDAAKAALDAEGLVTARAPDAFSDTAAAGVVVSSDPPAGQTLKRGDTVNVVVSKGPDVVTMPGVVGKPLAEAVGLIQQAGLTIGEVAGPDAGTVVAARPAEGQVVKRGTAVNLLLS